MCVASTQEDLNLFEASEDADEEFYAGGGQYRRHGLEHFPQLWCQNGSYSVYGQVRQMHWRKAGCHIGLTKAAQARCNAPGGTRPCMRAMKDCSPSRPPQL